MLAAGDLRNTMLVAHSSHINTAKGCTERCFTATDICLFLGLAVARGTLHVLLIIRFMVVARGGERSIQGNEGTGHVHTTEVARDNTATISSAQDAYNSFFCRTVPGF